MLINYRCESEVPIPANALKKCPQKRLFPAYYEIIEKPIDLALMRNRIDQGDYLSFDLFEQDFLLLIKNATVSIQQRERERSLDRRLSFSSRRTAERTRKLLERCCNCKNIF